jgi:hypothetical protein
MTPVTGEPRIDGSYRPVYVCSGAKEGRCDRPPFRVAMQDVDDSVLAYLADVGIDAEATLAALRGAAVRDGAGTAACEARTLRRGAAYKGGDAGDFFIDAGS